jgi:hypothetical protein
MFAVVETIHLPGKKPESHSYEFSNPLEAYNFCAGLRWHTVELARVGSMRHWWLTEGKYKMKEVKYV